MKTGDTNLTFPTSSL